MAKLFSSERLFQTSSRPLRRTKIKLLGYARLETLVQRREGGGGQRKEDGKSRETLLLIQPNPSGLKEKEQESNSERHPEFHKYCFLGGMLGHKAKRHSTCQSFS